MNQTTAKLSVHCCSIMDKMIEDGYLFETIALNWKQGQLDVHPPHIQGPTLTEHGRKRKPSMIINFCPWCGKKLIKEESKS